MAKFNVPNYVQDDGFGMSLNIRRGNPNPLDNSSVWTSYDAAHAYAMTDPVAYVGQILSVVETVTIGDESTTKVTAYKIENEAGDLVAVGTSPAGDESTITVADDGTVSLYGISGLSMTREDEEGNTVDITYQPLYVNGKLTWVEPSATTVEGLAAEIEGLKTRIGSLENTVGDADSGLVKGVADNASAIEAVNAKIGTVAENKTVVEMISDAQDAATYDDTDLSDRVTAIEDDYLTSSDKTELTNAIATAKSEAIEAIMGEAGIDEKYDTLKEVSDWILSDTTNSAQLITRVTNIENDYLNGADKTELADDIKELSDFIGTIPEGATSETVIAYIQEVVDGLKIGDYAKASDLTSLADRVSTLEQTITDKVDKVDGSRLMTDEEGTKLADIADGAQVNVIDSVDEEQFTIVDGKKLTLLDIAMSKITGLSDALNDKVDKEEGSRLITEAEITKLSKLVIDEETGDVGLSGSISAENVVGLPDMLAKKVDAVDGKSLVSDTLISKMEGVAEGAQANVIESISVGGTLLDIVDKAVDIPIGAGLKESTEVTIADDGTLGVGEINIDKIVQAEGTVLILDCGNAE